MRRILSLCIAAFLAVGLLAPSAFAGVVGGVRPDADPFVGELHLSGDGKNYFLQVGLSAFQLNGGNDFGSVGIEEIRGALAVDVAGGIANTQEFDAVFSHWFAFSPSDTAPNRGLYLYLQPKTVTMTKTYTFALALRHYNPDTRITTTTKHKQVSVALQGNAAQGAVVGFQPQPSWPGVTSVNMQADKYSYFELTSGVFQFNGADTALTGEKLAAFGLHAYTDNNSFTVDIYEISGRFYVGIHSLSTAAVGTHTGEVRLKSNTLQGIGEYVFLNYSITIATGIGSIPNNKITGIDANAQLGCEVNGIWGRAGINGRALSPGESLDNLFIKSGDYLTLEFNSDFFEWQNGKPSPAGWLTSSLLRNGRITVRRVGAATGSSNLIESPEIRYDSGRAYVYVKLKPSSATTKDKDFSFSVALAYNGSYKSGTEAVIAGTLTNDYLSVYRDDNEVDISRGEIAEAQEAVSRINVYIGEGVTVTVRMAKNKLYKGSVSLEPTGSDRGMMNKYSQIEMVYNLTTTGLGQSGKIVSIDAGGTYHVYDNALHYLGTTINKLPYANKYYLAVKKLNLTDKQDTGITATGANTGEVVEVPSGMLPGSNGMGGNGNFNPATGR